jgi:hypothetical protein
MLSDSGHGRAIHQCIDEEERAWRTICRHMADGLQREPGHPPSRAQAPRRSCAPSALSGRPHTLPTRIVLTLVATGLARWLGGSIWVTLGGGAVGRFPDSRQNFTQNLTRRNGIFSSKWDLNEPMRPARPSEKEPLKCSQEDTRVAETTRHAPPCMFGTNTLNWIPRTLVRPLANTRWISAAFVPT